MKTKDVEFLDINDKIQLAFEDGENPTYEFELIEVIRYDFFVVKYCVRVFETSGIGSSCKIPAVDQAKQLEELNYKIKDRDIIVTIDYLSEGFDLTQIKMKHEVVLLLQIEYVQINHAIVEIFVIIVEKLQEYIQIVNLVIVTVAPSACGAARRPTGMVINVMK